MQGKHPMQKTANKTTTKGEHKTVQKELQYDQF